MAVDTLLRHSAFPDGVTREGALSWYRAARARTREVFAIPNPDVFYERPIRLRNPIIFYVGHLPAFCVNTLVKLTFGRPGIDENLEVLFARGIDPDDASQVNEEDLWPDRKTVQEYVSAADALIEKTLAEAPLLEEPVLAILEHEAMHQETLLYMLHNLPYEKKSGGQTILSVPPERTDRIVCPPQTRIQIPAGTVTLGNDGGTFGWDNELPPTPAHVEAFEIEQHSVTNGAYLEYMAATGAAAPQFWLRRDGEWFWRGMFELVPLPLDWPVYVTYDEAAAYAGWQGGRVPSEAEYTRAAEGTPSDEGNLNFRNFDPVPAGWFPKAVSSWGVYDLVGNGWEWTSTVFAGFPGFQPMRSYPAYSVDFFDGQHFVLKGASPVTARSLVRRSFRNWFRPNYPYVYAKFRCVW